MLNLTSHKSETLGILCYVAYVLIFSYVFILINYLSKNMSAEFLSFMKFVATFTATLPFMLKNFSLFKTKIIWWHLLRTINGSFMMIFFFKSLVLIKIAEVTALSFIAPVLASCLAIFFYKERFYKLQFLICLPLAIIGGLISINFYYTLTLNEGSIYALLSTILVAFDMLITKKVAKHDKIFTCIFYAALFGIILNAYPGLRSAHTFIFSMEILVYLFLFMAIFLAGIILRLQAFRLATVNVLMPVDFSRLFFAALSGYIFLEQTINPNILIGATLIFIAIILSSFIQGEKKHEHIVSNQKINKS